MLDQGVYLPPSAYEAWFLSAAHDDRALQHVHRRPARGGRGGRSVRRRHRDRTSDESTSEDDRAPAAPRRGAQPAGHPLRPLDRASTSPSAAARWPTGSPTASATATSPTSSSSPLERAQETAAPLAAARGLTVELDERVIESSNIFEGKPFDLARLDPAPAAGLAAAVEPVPPVVGRAVQAGGRADVAGGAGRPRARQPGTRPSSSPTSCRSGSPGCKPRDGASCTTRASATARCAASPRSPSTDERLVSVGYSEPAGDLIPRRRPRRALLRRRRRRRAPAASWVPDLTCVRPPRSCSPCSSWAAVDVGLRWLAPAPATRGTSTGRA